MATALLNNDTRFNGSTTSANGSSLDTESKGFRVITGIVVIALSCVITTFLTIVIIILNKCKQIPFQIKWLSNGFIISAILSEVNVNIMTILLLFLDISYFNIIFYMRIIVTACFTNVGWGCTVLIALERIVALSVPLHYGSLIKRSRLAILILVTWTTCFAVPLVISTWIAFKNCSTLLQDCDMFHVLRPTRLYYTTSISIFLVFNVFAYVRLSNIIRRHTLAIAKNNICEEIVTVTKSSKRKHNMKALEKGRLLRVTKTITSIILTFACLHLLPIIHTVSFDVLPSLREPVWQSVFQSCSYLASYINSLLCSYMYVWKIQECKMIFLRMFMSWNKHCRDLAEQIRLSVYNVVTMEKKSDC